MNYASISRRFGAILIDGLILILPAAILGSLIPVLGGILVWFFYAPFLESSVIRATIGKKLMGVQVSDMAGGRLTFRAAMVRALMKLISGFLLFIPHLLAFFTEKKQALHDLVADTVVVYGRVEIPVVDAWLEQVKDVFRIQQSEGRDTSKLTELERLQNLFERGALTKEEFDKEKAKILG